MNVLLVFPNYTCLDELSKWWFPSVNKRRGNPTLPPLGLLHVHSVVSQNHDVHIIDNMVEKLSDKSLAKMCLRFKPDVVGFGGTMLQWPQAKHVASVVKKTNPKIVTVYGGPNATARPEKHVFYFDYVFRGMAEETFPRFLKALSIGSSIKGIGGLCWKDHIVQPCLELDLDVIPMLNRKAMKWNRYRRSAISLPSPTDSVLSSRGCPYECRFCSSRHIWNRKWFPRSVFKVIEEVQWLLANMGTKSIHFREDNFTVNKKRLQQFCKELSGIGMPWICQSRVDAIDEPTIRMMKDAGCKMISCGFESINDSTLTYMQKGQTSAQVRKAIEVLETVGMRYTGVFMIATPNEGVEEITNTIRFAQDVSKYPHSRLPSHACRFVGMPVSELYWEIQTEGLVEYNWQDGELLFPGTKSLTSAEVDKVIEDCGSPSRP